MTMYKVSCEQVERSNKKDEAMRRLPPGYRFVPTDEEILIHYLGKKIFRLPFPAYVIPELDVFRSLPSQLPGELEEKRYFFCKRNTGYRRHNRLMCPGYVGYWKAVHNRDKVIVAPGYNNNKQPIGLKKSFVFYQGKNVKTPWCMEEYRLLLPSLPIQGVQQLEMDWVVYCIHEKKKTTKRNYDGEEIRDFSDNDGRLNPHSASQSTCSSSTFTSEEISCDESDQEEVSSKPSIM